MTEDTPHTSSVPRPELGADDGYTVIEGMIAAALLTTVLIVAAGMLTWMTTRHSQADNIRALTMAEGVIEQYATSRDAEVDAGITSDGRWWVAVDETAEPGLVHVTVRVWRLRSGAPRENESRRDGFIGAGGRGEARQRAAPPNRHPDVTLTTSRFDRSTNP